MEATAISHTSTAITQTTSSIMMAAASWLDLYGLPAKYSMLGAQILGCFLMAFGGWLVNFVTKRIIVAAVTDIIRKTDNKWDDLLLDCDVLPRFSHLAPALLLHIMTPVVFFDSPSMKHFFSIAIAMYLVFIGTRIIHAALDMSLMLYQETIHAQKLALKGIVQAIKIAIALVAAIMMLSIMFDKSPLFFISGLGAMTAVLMLIFKDAILGLVAGIQLSLNNQVKAGDWIEIPSQNTEGTVIDVSLTNIQIQNADNTVTSVPAYTMTSTSFKNYRAIAELGGRRLKKAMFIDVNSVAFMTEQDIEEFKKVDLLRDYLVEKTAEIATYNTKKSAGQDSPVNGRRLTNLGTFRNYVRLYLRSHPKIHQNMTLMVRQLDPGPQGIAVEIYAYTTETAWVQCEAVQSDLLEHLYAVLPSFGLRAFQNPSGTDIARVATLLGK